MKRTVRLGTLCGEIRPCEVFADVGCDHGYCSQYVLENGLCKRCYISDISRASLQKAEKLLSAYIESGTVQSFCCAGLEKVPRDADEVLIAGMGGEEMIAILREGYLPERLVLQPMKNTPKVRAFLLENGYAIVRDYLFYDGKFYDVVCAERRGDVRKYDERALQFGYDNLHSPSQDFLMYLRTEAEKCRARLAGGGAPAVRERLQLLTEVADEAQRNI